MPEEFFVRELANGMTLLGQRMEYVSSAAMTLVVPAGAAYDSAGAEGAAAVAVEWRLRGAGDRNSRQLNDALDTLGCQHHEAVLSEHVCFSAAQLGRNLEQVLGVYADILRRPRLEDSTFPPSRALVLQDLVALEDEPAQKCNVLLRERFYPYPLGRCVFGQVESLQGITPQKLRRHISECFVPRGTILAVAGNIDWEAFCGLVGEHFGDWSAESTEAVKTRPPEGGVIHIKKDSAQVHIALAHRSCPISDGRYYAARVAEAVLSGGMSSRLFTEVREKRGLAYHVSTRYHSLKGHAGMFTYAATLPERAQQTLDITIGELRRLAEGIEPDELTRAQTQLKSSLIMQGESTTARADALASDWYHLRRLRSLEELSKAIEKVTADDVLEYLRHFPAERFTVLVIGPEPLDTSTMNK